MRRAVVLATTLLVIHTATATAQEPGVTFVDPAQQSPSGSQYEIPVETGRRDAAPTPPKASSPKTPGTAAIQTAEGYGTPTTVPGAASGRRSRAASRAAGGLVGGGDASNGGGDVATAPDPRAVPGERLASTGPSVGRSVLLLALALAVGLVLGGFGRSWAR